MHTSTVISARRVASVAMAGLLLAACNTTKPVELAASAPRTTPGTQAGTDGSTIPAYCPQISLREGTAILRKGEGDDLQYLASIASTTRSCRVKDGELYMEVGIAGRLVPGPAAKPGNVNLPIRIAIVNAGNVAYTNLGQQSVSTDPAGGPKDFSYVDRAIRIPVPAGKLVVYAGFDEGAPKGRSATPKS